MSQPRRHHYVPKFYLAGFTESGTPDGRLFVWDKETGKRWQATPNGVAHERDFHAVDLGPGTDPMIVERGLAVCEGKWSTAIKEIDTRRTLGNDVHYANLLEFVACLAVRVPGIRNSITGFVDTVTKSLIRTTLATPEGRDRIRKHMKATSLKMTPAKRAELEQVLRDDPNLDDMTRFMDSDQYSANYNQTWHVQTMLQMAIHLFPLLTA